MVPTSDTALSLIFCAAFFQHRAEKKNSPTISVAEWRFIFIKAMCSLHSSSRSSWLDSVCCNANDACSWRSWCQSCTYKEETRNSTSGGRSGKKPCERPINLNARQDFGWIRIRSQRKKEAHLFQDIHSFREEILVPSASWLRALLCD